VAFVGVFAVVAVGVGAAVVAARQPARTVVATALGAE
jgi:hypothetical protein